MQRTTSWVGVGVVLVALTLGAGCPEQQSTERDEVAAPSVEALEIAAERPGLVFRYVDPSSGQVATASAVAEIPEGSRRLVVVFDTEAPPPPGWDLVADLSRGLPATAEPREGFTFPIAARPASPDRRAGAPEVVMFATAWCGYCDRARSFFKKNRIPFTEHDIETDSRAQGRLAELGRRAGVPQGQLQGVPIVFVDGQVMVGWDEARLKRLLKM